MQLLTQKTNHNNQIKTNSNKPSFKGHTIPPIGIGSGHGYIHHYELPKNATPNYPGAFPNAKTKIYKADPFEIIPEEIYKTHDYTIRDDLRLSQIQKDYKTGYHNFASNAWNEKKFLEFTADKYQEKIDEHNYNINEFDKRIKFSESKPVQEKYALMLDNRSKELAKDNEIKQTTLNALANANERFTLLKELDDTVGERDKIYSNVKGIRDDIADMQKYNNTTPDLVQNTFNRGRENKKLLKSYIKESDNRVNNAILKGKSQNELQKIMQEEVEYKLKVQEEYKKTRINSLNFVLNARKKIKENQVMLPKQQENLQALEARLPELYKQIEDCMMKISKLYKTKYPNWL